jgi:hypothetical protein
MCHFLNTDNTCIFHKNLVFCLKTILILADKSGDPCGFVTGCELDFPVRSSPSSWLAGLSPSSGPSPIARRMSGPSPLSRTLSGPSPLSRRMSGPLPSSRRLDVASPLSGRPRSGTSFSSGRRGSGLLPSSGAVLRIRNVYTGSECFRFRILDPNFFLSRI